MMLIEKITVPAERKIKLLDSAKRLQPHLIAVRRELHEHPETSCNEKETAERIVGKLSAIGGYRIRTNVGGYGVVADLKGAHEGNVTALRADMDALAVTERTGLPYASKKAGIMHACGHDMHTAILLGAAQLLREYQEEICGTVRLIFQPAEELAPEGGAKKMISEGVLEDVDAVFGIHIWPDLPSGVLGIKPGVQMASSDHFYVHIEGKSSHGAQPDRGNDALVAGCQFMTAVQTIISRNRNPAKAAAITVGRFEAGSRYNVIPGNCDMEGTVRTFDRNTRQMIRDRLQELLQGICEAFDCKGRLDYQYGYSALENEERMTDYFCDVTEQLFGTGYIEKVAEPSMCAEDFSFYLEKTAGAFGWLGCTKKGAEVWPLHSGRCAPDEDILWRGSALLCGLAMEYGGSFVTARKLI